MIFHDRIGDVLKQCRLAGARRSDDQTALAFAKRRHQIHDPRGVTIGRRFQLDPLVRVDRRQFFEGPQILVLRRLVIVDLEQPSQLRAAIAAAGLAVDPHSVAELEAPHDFRRDENVLWCLDEVAFRVAQKTKAFAGNLDDAFAVFRFARRLVAVRQTALCPVGFLGRSVFARLAGGQARFRGVCAPALAFLRSIFLEDIRRASVPGVVVVRFVESAGSALGVVAAPGTAP